LNENRSGLQKVLQKIANQEISKVVVEYKDRLARFGFSYLTAYTQAFGGEIIVMDQEEKDEQQELVDDLIAITTSFSARIYGTRDGNKLVDAVQTVLQADDEFS
jgi:predicted site-specific integrase-resolvase